MPAFPSIGSPPNDPKRYWEWLHNLHHVVAGIMEGRQNNTGSVTLADGTTTTTLADQRLSGSSVVLFSPRSANAAAATANLYVSAKAKGSLTLTHANTGTTDRTFDYAIFG